MTKGGGPPASLKNYWQKSETGFRKLTLIFPLIFFHFVKSTRQMVIFDTNRQRKILAAQKLGFRSSLYPLLG